MERMVLPILVAATSILRAAGQSYIYVRHPDLVERMPPLQFFVSFDIIVLHIFAAYFAFKKPFLAFIILIVVFAVHFVLYPLGAFISSDIELGFNFWNGFVVSASSHIVGAALAYVSWQVARRSNNERSNRVQRKDQIAANCLLIVGGALFCAGPWITTGSISWVSLTVVIVALFLLAVKWASPSSPESI